LTIFIVSIPNFNYTRKLRFWIKRAKFSFIF